MTHDTVWRRWHRQWLPKALHATTCPHRHGRHGRCGAVLDTVTVDGRVTVRCAACERRLAGICRDCPRPVEGLVGRALRCRGCKRRAVARALTRYDRRHAAERAAKAKRRYHTDPAYRAHRVALARAWRAAHPEHKLRRAA